jgi:glucan phosphoethanolaminetransferase (alkaline phosphatase superfamily)
MKKGLFVALCLVLLVSGLGIVLAIESPSSEDVGVYANLAGDYLLKFQELLLGALSFLSFGVLKYGGALAFTQFLLMILVFMIVYTVAGFFSEKFNFLISGIITVLAFMTMDVETINSILTTYEGLGIAITVFLPVLIVLSFTFRIYERAYAGKSETSPFYAEVFNFVFLIFFGIFFIRYSGSEEGTIAFMRLVSGWVLIGLGVMQVILYKALAKSLHKTFVEGRKMGNEILEAKRQADLKSVKAVTSASLGE